VESHLTLKTQAFLTAIVLSALISVAPVKSSTPSVLPGSGPAVISAGVYAVEDLVFGHEKLSRTIVTVNSEISCQSATRCIMNLPYPLDDMVGLILSALEPTERERIVLKFANRHCLLSITGFYDGVQLEAHNVELATGTRCAHSSTEPDTNR
jgi:hypothetical protein